MVVTSRVALAERLAAWPGNDGLMTWALVVVGAVPSAGELDAAREAGKLCDAVVAVRLACGKPVAPKFAETLRAAGVDMVWVPKDVSGPVRVDVGVDLPEGGATLILQAIMAVLPTLVLVPRGALPVVRALRNIQSGLGELFSLRIVGEV